MANKKPLPLGEVFGRLTVVGRGPTLRQRQGTYICECECGVVKPIRANNLKQGLTISCGCAWREAHMEACKTHGYKNHLLYAIWVSIKRRCNDGSNSRYGGRGITLCKEWCDAKAFIDWAISNGWSKGLQIDRSNNDLGYSPENCRFVTRLVNAQNTSRAKYWVVNGVTYNSSREAARATGLSQKTIVKKCNDETTEAFSSHLKYAGG